MTTWIGLDNGISGSCGILSGDSANYVKTPTRKCLNYTKSKQIITRIDTAKLYQLFYPYIANSFCMIERPVTAMGRYKAVVSGMRAMEATMIVLENLQIPYQFVDSREWQKVLLPKGLEKEELKFASLDVGKRLFPTIDFDGFKDADGILIAEYARRAFPGQKGVEAA